MSEENKQIPTSGTEWRKAREEGMLVTLPSGKVARLRPVSVTALYASGDMPEQLTPVVQAMLFGKTPTEDNMAEFMKSTHALNVLICKEAFIEPRIVEKPITDDEISFADLTGEEVEYVFSWVSNPQKTLEPFRDEQNKPVAVVRERNYVQGEAE